PFGHSAPPSPAIHNSAPPAAIHEGAILYGTYCWYCHGIMAVAGASVPDLRYSSAETHQQFESIVLGGSRESRDMPSFQETLKPGQVRAIQAYVLLRAAESSSSSTSKEPASPPSSSPPR